MIGGMGFTNWRREWQLALTISSTASTWSSSTPTRMVALPCFKKPPDECSRVARNSRSSSASTRLAASSLWTIAVTSFMARLCRRGVTGGHPSDAAPPSCGPSLQALTAAPDSCSAGEPISHDPPEIGGCGPVSLSYASPAEQFGDDSAETWSIRSPAEHPATMRSAAQVRPKAAFTWGWKRYQSTTPAIAIDTTVPRALAELRYIEGC